MNLSKLAKYYLECEIPQEDLLRVFPFDFFLTGEGLNDEELKNLTYKEIADNIQALFLERDDEYIRSMAMFITKILESNIFIERVYVDTFCHLAK